MSKWRIKNRKSKDPDVVLDSIAVESRPVKQGGSSQTVRLREIFNYLAGLKTTDQPAPPKPGNATPDMIREGENLLIAFCADLYADHIAGDPGSDRLFLIDENLPRDIGIDLWNEFGRATSTSYESLNGRPDKIVWEWAVNNRIDGIISMDVNMRSSKKDLGLIATKNAYDLLRKKDSGGLAPGSLPLIIQIKLSREEEKRDLNDRALLILKKHERFIFRELANRSTPYIQISSAKAVSGPTYEELASTDWEELRERIYTKKTKPATSQQSGSSSLPSQDPAP